ncbi:MULTISPECIES: trypsin-like serine protease [Vibrio]|uniref:Trypsin-like serine protease n=1 Tax=Vibrio anguillarum TaxID=55601 RepID=A0ABD4QYM9_VIBAN|nr:MULTISPECIES: trypsin-like serine protease [Vibrio]ASG04896.1 trypsin [Vibrio anguillarum]ASG05792.1 trypsin [Vibrio anguillarum]MBT2920298.1 trypsin-like serine protease [Vibrio anguillarum]NNN98470.1 trypsin-like serine protease [Vibrio sp. B1-2]
MKKKQILPCFIPIATIVSMSSFQAHAVYNGIEIVPQDAPYMVYLERRGIVCSGALIAPNTVLTAQHCAFDNLNAHFFYSKNKNGTINGEIKKVVKSYAIDHLNDYDIAILELESTPEGIEFLPVASDDIPLGAEVYPLGYSSGQLKKMPIPAKVAAKENSKAYYTEVHFSGCPTSPYYSNIYYNQPSIEHDEARCRYFEWAFKKTQSRNLAHATPYTISVENPPLPPSHPDYELDESSGYVTKYSSTKGDSGGPLIFDGKIYGVASFVANVYSAPYNAATYYEGLGREGAYEWIMETVANIQSRIEDKDSSPKEPSESKPIIFLEDLDDTEQPKYRTIIFPDN